MAFLKDRKKVMNENRKRHFIRQWLSSLAITTVVVVAAVIAPSSPPNAFFERIGTFDDSIYYDVNVTDVSNSIVDDSLMIIVESQYDHYEIPLALGLNSGVVENLRENTKYDVLVVASRGFGSETLAKESLTTVVRSGGAILSVELSTTDPSQYELEYLIRTKYLDLDQIYQSVRLNYCIDYHEPHEQPQDECIDYVSIALSSEDEENFILVPNYNLTVYLVLEATNALGNEIILDTMSFKTPLNIDGSLYLRDVTYESVEISAYVDFTVVDGIKYYLELYENIKLINQFELTEPVSSVQMDSNTLIIDELKTETTYSLVLKANYVDPLTEVLTDIEITSIEFSTTPNYFVTVNMTEDIDFYYIDISIDDPSNILHQFYYIIYDVSGDYPVYIIEMPISMTLTLDDLKVSTFSLLKPVGYDYEIRIVCNKVLNLETTYYSTPLYVITNDLT